MLRAAPHLYGIDDRLTGDLSSADNVENLRWDPRYSRWVNDRGFAAYLPASPGKASPNTGEAVRAITLLQTQSGGTQDILIEQDNGSGGCEIYSLAPFESSGKLSYPDALDRHLPTPQDVPTVFAGFGRYAVAVNGYDAPIKLYPVTSSYPKSAAYGWTDRPAPCQPQPIAESSIGGNYAQSVGTDDVTVQLPKNNVIGVGNSTGSAQNSYRYRYSWVSEDGSESPLSEPSPVISWQTILAGCRYGITVTSIATGPKGTKSRRLYRTKNLGDTATYENLTYYYVADLSNNYETTFADITPDGLLGSTSPTDIDSAPLPATIRWITAHAGRAWVVAGDYRVHWSGSRQYEAFGATSYVDVSTRDTGLITGLLSNNDLLWVLRERGIEAIYDAGNGLYRATPLIGTLGTRAPHAAISVPDWGVFIVADDGIYVASGSLAGGEKINATQVSAQVTSIWSRVNISALPQAYAVYNKVDREIIFGLPIDGSTYCNFQLVFHLYASKSAQREVWSTRTGVMATCATTGVEGFPLFGGHAFDDDLGAVSVSVWYGVDQWGYDASYNPAARPLAKWASNFTDLGNPNQDKALHMVTWGAQQYGDNLITCNVYKDGDYAPSRTDTSYQQIADRNHTNVYGPIDSVREAVLGSSVWTKIGLAQLRCDYQAYDGRRWKVEFTSDKVYSINEIILDIEVKDQPTKPYAPNGNLVGRNR